MREVELDQKNSIELEWCVTNRYRNTPDTHRLWMRYAHRIRSNPENYKISVGHNDH